MPAGRFGVKATNNFRRNPRDETVGRDVFGYYAASADNGTPADRDTFKNNGPYREPDVVFQDDGGGFPRLGQVASLMVVAVHNADVRGNLTAVSYRDLPVRGQAGTVIEKHAVPDIDNAVFMRDEFRAHRSVELQEPIAYPQCPPIQNKRFSVYPGLSAQSIAPAKIPPRAQEVKSFVQEIPKCHSTAAPLLWRFRDVSSVLACFVVSGFRLLADDLNP